MTLHRTSCDAAGWLSCGALALVLGACATGQPPSQAPAQTPVAVAPTTSERDANETTIQLSAELMSECGFSAEPGETPRFDLAQATLRPRGRNILADVANCMTEGPLQHRTITVIGRADPRGSEAQNHELGASRAEAARNYLLERGAPAEKILVVSRGEQGATGNEQEGWALDRRVDLVLGDRTERSNISEQPPANARPNRPANDAASYADQSEGSAQSGKVTGRSGPGNATVGAGADATGK